MNNGLSLRDKRILDLSAAGKTAEEISQELQVPAARVVAEIDRLTNTVDWLSELQRYRLLVWNLWSLLGSLKEKAETGADPLLVKSYLETIRLGLETVDKQMNKVNDDLDRVEAAHARRFVEIIEQSYFVALDRLQVKFPDLDREAFEMEMQDAIRFVAAEIDKASQ